MTVPSLASIHGHHAVVRLLRRLLIVGRLPHAVILDGIPGCGRRTLGLALAKAFLCPSPREGDACGGCSSCHMVDAGHHPDLTVLSHDTEAASVPVETVREEVVLRAGQSSLAGHGCVFIVPGVERLRHEAVNALLKVLEEPPDRVLMVLTTDRVDGLLKTVRSRCQVYRLGPLTEEELAAVLIDRGADPTAARRQAATAHGSLRRCGAATVAEPPVGELLALLDGGLRYTRIGRLLHRLEEEAASAPGETAVAQRRGLLERWLDDVLHLLRGRLRESPDERTVRQMERVLARQGELGLNLQPRTVLESLALQE